MTTGGDVRTPAWRKKAWLSRRFFARLFTMLQDLTPGEIDGLGAYLPILKAFKTGMYATVTARHRGPKGKAARAKAARAIARARRRAR